MTNTREKFIPSREHFVDKIVPKLNFPPVAEDICDYYSLTMEELETLYDNFKIGAQNQDLIDHWHSLTPDPNDSKEVAKVYEQSDWGYVLEQAFSDRASYGKYKRCRPYIKGDKLLDYGTAVGNLALYFHDLKQLNVTAADLKSPHFELAKYRFKKYAPDIEPLEIDPENPPVGGWNTIVCLDVLEHVPNWKRVLESFSASQTGKDRLILKICFGRHGKVSLHISEQNGLLPDVVRSEIKSSNYRIIHEKMDNPNNIFFVCEKTD